MERELRQILLVDDCASDVFLHTRVIEETTVAVISVRNGKEAIGLIEGNFLENCPQPDLIFLDINSPGMSGWDFLSLYKEKKWDEKLNAVIIMLSGSIDPSDEERASELDLVDGYCVKPLTLDLLNGFVSQHF